MTDSSASKSTVSPSPRILPARFLGVLFSPRATYADVAARPRWLGIFALVVVLAGGATGGFMSTEVGQRALLDQQISQSQAFGRTMSQAQLDAMERMAPYFVYVAPILQLVFFGFGGLVIAGIVVAVFNAALGGDATFKQVFAVVSHSGVVLALGALFVLPLAYARESLSSATTLGVFFPFLDESSFAARFLGGIDLIRTWWMISLAIGLGVLYRKRTGPIAMTFIFLYAAVAIVIAAIQSALLGS